MIKQFTELSPVGKTIFGVISGVLTIGAMFTLFAAFEEHVASADELAALDEHLHIEFAGEFATRDKEIQYVAQSLQMINRSMIIRQITAYRSQIAMIEGQAAGRVLTHNEQNTIAMLEREIKRLELELKK